MVLSLRYGFRNLFRHRLRTALTVLGIALVIATSVIMLVYARGLVHSLRSNGDPENLLVISRRASDPAFSSFKTGEFAVLTTLVGEEVARQPVVGGTGTIDLIAPFVHHTFIIKIDGVEGGRYGDRKLGLVKGVDPARAFHLSRRFQLLEGRTLTPEDERVAMVGSLAWARLGVERGDLVEGAVLVFNGVRWPVVGVFDTGGTGGDGEIWVPVNELMAVLNRTDYNSAVIKAGSLEKRDRILQTVNRSDQTELRALTEEEYYRGYAESFRTFATIGLVMAVITALGGLMVGLNTMYTAVSGRVREIGMLQVLGFPKGAILRAIMLESLLISLAGGVLGCALGSLVHGMPMKVTMGVFLMRVDAVVIAGGLGLAVGIGLLGAWFPARRALRLSEVDAMRSA